MTSSEPTPRRRLRLNPLSLELFIEIIEAGSIAAVADRTHVAASGISKRVSDLEATLGTSLIRRTNRGIEASDAGLVLGGLARNLLNDLDEIYFRMRDYSAGIQGQVRLIANRSSIIGFLPRQLKAFTQQHPRVQVRLDERMSAFVARSLLQNDADVGLLWLPKYPAGLELMPYHSDELAVITPIDHALAAQKSVKFADTLDVDLIGLHDDAVAQLHEAAAAARKTLRVRMQVSSFDAMCAMVGAGLGIGVLPRSSIASESIGTRLKVIKLDEPWARRDMQVGTRSYDALSPAGKLLFDHLARRTGQRRRSPRL